jgi:signal transduction histidine kinase
MLWAMLRIYYHLAASQAFALDLIAGLVCLLAAYTALSLAVKPGPAERIRYPWVIAAGVAVGFGGWAAHLILLLGFQPGVPFAFKFGPTAVALAVGTVGSWIGLFVARRTDLMPLGGAIVGFAIAAMFYVGMTGVQFSASEHWDALYVTISVLLGASFGAAALARGHLSPDIRGRLISTVLLSVSIMSTCVVGLSALNLTSDPSIVVPNDTALPVLLGISLTAVVMLIASLGIVGTLIDRYVGEIESAKHDLERTSAGLTTALKAAEAANRTKTEFLHNMSHELRTPLNAILGFSELLHSGGVAAKSKEYGGLIYGAGQHLLCLINDILDLAKIEAGGWTMAETALDFWVLTSSCRELIMGTANANRISLTIDIARDLPYITADERALKQILLNLISNAIKFTRAGGEAVVFARLEPDGEFAFGVKDTGIGIAEADQARVFDSFGQGRHDSVTANKGTGLGLPIVKGLAFAHGGRVALQSEIGVGTCVTVFLPANRVGLLRPLQVA